MEHGSRRISLVYVMHYYTIPSKGPNHLVASTTLRIFNHQAKYRPKERILTEH